MKNLELLPLSDESKKRLAEFAKQYRRMAHIVVEIVSYSDNRLIVRIEQKDMVNNILLSKKELMERAREMFKGEIPDDWKLTVSAVNFDRKDISNYTGIDKCTLSSLFAGDKELTKWHKVAFYYFFKFYEVARF